MTKPNFFAPPPKANGVPLRTLIGTALIRKRTANPVGYVDPATPGARRGNRATKRKGLAFRQEPAAFPARHGICKHTGKRTWLSVLGYSREAYLAGEGPIEDTFR